MDITIVNAVYEDRYKFVPIGPLYIAAVLEELGWSVDFRDYQVNARANPLDVESFVAFLDNSAPVIGIGCFADLLPLVILAMEKLKEKHPGKTIILGGEGPTGVAEELLEHFPFIDYIVKGEGEQTIRHLLRCLETGGDPGRVAGIAYRDGNTRTVQVNPARGLIADLDTLPFPAYHKVDFRDYSMIGLVSSRGCPFRCIFCDVAPFWRYRSRPRGLDLLLEEIKILHRYGRDSITFYDELFILDRKRVLEFCRKLKKESPQTRWSCLARTDSMDEELMKELADSGCFMVSYGIESGSEKILRRIGKKLTRAGIEKTISLSVKYFEYVQAFFIWGFPFETMEDFFETIDLIDITTKLGAVPDVSFLAPLPLSPLYKENRDRLEFSRKLYLDAHPHIPADHPVVDLIASHPSVFPSFYVWEPGQMAEKFDIARKYNVHLPLMR